MMSMTLKTLLIGAAAAGAFAAAAFVAIGQARSEPHRGDRFDDRAGYHRPMHRVTGHGRFAGGSYLLPSYVVEWQARRLAIADWRRKVVNRYGHRYAYWWWARTKTVTCNGGLGVVRCEASAIPSADRRYWSALDREAPRITR
jgi:hypothetical protein